MINDLIADITHRLQQAKADVADSSQLKSIVASALQKLDVVSREEFDAQTAILARTRQQLNKLEQQFNALERQLNDNAPEK